MLLNCSIFSTIIIIIIITFFFFFFRHQLGFDRPVSALSYGPFKGLPSRLLPFGL
jgi:hypothetical protein